jgi:hypothetical protein
MLGFDLLFAEFGGVVNKQVDDDVACRCLEKNTHIFRIIQWTDSVPGCFVELLNPMYSRQLS